MPPCSSPPSSPACSRPSATRSPSLSTSASGPRPAPPAPVTGDERRRALIGLLPACGLFLVVLGGIYLGVFTPTEAAAFGVVGTGIIAVFNRVGLPAFVQSLRETTTATGMIFLIIIGAEVFNGFMALDFGLAPDHAAIWFGIIVLVVVEVGLITPPVGLNVFVINKMAKDVPMRETFKGVLPFLLSDAVRVALLLAFPALTYGLLGAFGY